MKTLFIAWMALSLTAFADHKPGHKSESKKTPVHREGKAHKHGAAHVAIAFEGANGEIDFDAPAEGIYGFEYAPKTEADKTKQHNSFALMETNIGDMIQFDKDLKCEFSKQKIEIEQEGQHADMEAQFKVICQKSPSGTTVVLNFQKTFPKLKEVKVDFIADEVQKSATSTKDGTKLVLKK